MVNVNQAMNLIIFMSQIASIVAYDDLSAKLTPLIRIVECLIDVAKTIKRWIRNCSSESQISVSIVIVVNIDELRVSPNRRSPHNTPLDLEFRCKI